MDNLSFRRQKISRWVKIVATEETKSQKSKEKTIPKTNKNITKGSYYANQLDKLSGKINEKRPSHFL